MDPGWKEFAAMTLMAANAIRRICPQMKLVLGGMSPIDTSPPLVLEEFAYFAEEVVTRHFSHCAIPRVVGGTAL